MLSSVLLCLAAASPPEPTPYAFAGPSPADNTATVSLGGGAWHAGGKYRPTADFGVRAGLGDGVDLDIRFATRVTFSVLDTGVRFRLFESLLGDLWISAIWTTAQQDAPFFGPTQTGLAPGLLFTTGWEWIRLTGRVDMPTYLLGLFLSGPDSFRSGFHPTVRTSATLELGLGNEASLYGRFEYWFGDITADNAPRLGPIISAGITF